MVLLIESTYIIFNIVQKNISHILHPPDDGSRLAFWKFAAILDAHTFTSKFLHAKTLQLN